MNEELSTVVDAAASGKRNCHDRQSRQRKAAFDLIRQLYWQKQVIRNFKRYIIDSRIQYTNLRLSQ